MTAALPDRAAAEDFLYREAELLDAARWQDWFGLFTDDAWYWVPGRPGQPDPLNEVSLIYDDIANLQARVARMHDPSHHANRPAVRAIRHVSNIRLSAAGAGGCRVTSRLLLVDRRGDALRRFSAGVEHGLRMVDGQIRIAWKKVELLDADAPQEEMVVPF